MISERTFEIKHRSIHSKPNGFWHVSFSCQRANFLSGRKVTADSDSVTPRVGLSRQTKRQKIISTAPPTDDLRLADHMQERRIRFGKRPPRRRHNRRERSSSEIIRGAEEGDSTQRYSRGQPCSNGTGSYVKQRVLTQGAKPKGLDKGARQRFVTVGR